uniref:Uncharacterized protein n=1 Tax=Heterorhabditis bacteriophora TaxID=37862 RepID=A0A1I7W7R2_HETBA
MYSVNLILKISSLNWQQRHQHIRRVIDNLPPDVRRFLPPPPPPLGFEHLSPETKQRLIAIHDNRNLGHIERFKKIKVGELINDLPPEIRSKFPPSTPLFD